MELLIKIAWVLLALLHITPAMSAIFPIAVQRLYGVAPEGEVGVLLIHRGALFIAICAAAIYAALDPSSRRLASIILGVSMLGFLIVYSRAGMPAGDLRKIAYADLVGLIPLVWVSLQAWR